MNGTIEILADYAWSRSRLLSVILSEKEPMYRQL